MKNERSLHNLQFQSLKFQNLTKSVLEHFFGRKVNQSPLKVESYQKWSLGEKFQEFTSLVPQLSELAEMAPRCLTLDEKTTKVLGIVKCVKNGPCYNFGEISSQVPKFLLITFWVLVIYNY